MNHEILRQLEWDVEKRKVRRKNKSKEERETVYTWSEGKEWRDRKRGSGRRKERDETERKHR